VGARQVLKSRVHGADGLTRGAKEAKDLVRRGRRSSVAQARCTQTRGLCPKGQLSDLPHASEVEIEP